MSQEYDLLKNALLSRRSCYAVYDGYERYFCPHIIGTKLGEEQVLCWQYAGESSRPLPPGGQWKCLTISKLSQLRTTDDVWQAGEPGRTGVPSTCVDQIDEQIEL